VIHKHIIISGGVRLRAFYLFGHTIAHGAGITKNMLLTIQKRTIARKIRSDVAKLLLKFKKL